jgi:hypothetical protein
LKFVVVESSGRPDGQSRKPHQGTSSLDDARFRAGSSKKINSAAIKETQMLTALTYWIGVASDAETTL